MKNRRRSHVRDWMTPDPTTIPTDTTLAEAYDLMLTHGFRRLPVVDDDGELIGIITRSDIQQIIPVMCDEEERSEAELALAEMPIREAMTWDPVTISPGHVLQAAAELMLEYQVSGLPVVEAGQVVGIITESDVFRAIVESWAETGPEE